MAMLLAAYTGNSTTVDASSFTTASINPVANGLIVAVIGNSAGTPGTPTLSGNGLTWTQAITRLPAALAQRITIFTAVVPDSGFTSGAVTISFAGATQSSCQWSIISLTDGGADYAGGWAWGDPVVQSKGAEGTAATSGSFTLTSAISDTVNNMVIAGFRHVATENTAPKASSPAWTEIHDVQGSSPSYGLETQANRDIPTDNAPSASWATSSAWVGVAVEIRPPVAPPAQSRTATDSAPATDTAGRSAVSSRAAVDTAAAADAATRATVKARAATDTAAAADVAGRAAQGARTAADAAAATDTAVGATTKTRAAADAAQASDTATRAQSAARTTSDTAGTTDSATRATVKARTATDTAPATDAAARATVDLRTAADTAPATDNAAALAPNTRTASDTAPAADTASPVTAEARTATDTAAASDAATRTAVRARTATDTAPASDSTATRRLFGRTATDTAPAVDSATGTVTGPTGPALVIVIARPRSFTVDATARTTTTLARTRPRTVEAQPL